MSEVPDVLAGLVTSGRPEGLAELERFSAYRTIQCEICRRPIRQGTPLSRSQRYWNAHPGCLDQERDGRDPRG